MAFARKFTRRITVGEETYLWYLRDNILESRIRHIAIRHSTKQGQLLLVDPFTDEIKPRRIRAAILFALSRDWQPQVAGAPMYIGYQETKFVLLSARRPYVQAFMWPES